MCCLTWLVFLYLRLVLLRLLLWHLLSFLLASFVLRQATSSLEPTWSCALAALGLSLHACGDLHRAVEAYHAALALTVLVHVVRCFEMYMCSDECACGWVSCVRKRSAVYTCAS